MYRPPEKQPDPPSSNRSRLPTMKGLPEVNDLRGLFSEAQKYHNKLIEQPFLCANESETMVLTVELQIGETTPIWALYRGDGPGSIMIWHCPERDFELIYDVVSMFIYEVEKDHYQTTQPIEEAEFRDAGSEPAATSPADAGSRSYFDNITPVDFDLLKKQSNVLLGYMFVEAGFVSEPMLETALKLQEMVRNDTLTPMQACETLRRTHAREGGSAPQAKAASAPESKKVVSKETQLVVELLTKAGIVTEADMQAVVAVKRKHGGDVGAMLVSAGKLDQSTYEAAEKCWPWVRDGLMKPEQAIIALGYCQRARMTLEEAMDDLGYDKPAD